MVEHKHGEGLLSACRRIVIPRGEASKASDQSPLRGVFVLFKAFTYASMAQAFHKTKIPSAGCRTGLI